MTPGVTSEVVTTPKDNSEVVATPGGFPEVVSSPVVCLEVVENFDCLEGHEDSYYDFPFKALQR